MVSRRLFRVHIPAVLVIASMGPTALHAQQEGPFGNLIGSMTSGKGDGATNPATAGSWRYIPDSARRNANQKKAIAEARKSNPALADVYEMLATQADVYAIIADYLAKYDMRADDLGDVMALYWFSAYQIANGGRTDDPTKAQLASIRAQLDGVGTELKMLSDADKQMFADAMMLDMAVQQGALEAAKESSPELVGQLATAFTAQNNALFGFDFGAVTLSPKGLIPKLAPTPKPATAKVTKGPTGAGAAKDYSHMDQILGVKYDSQLMFMAGGPAGYLNRTETTRVLFKDGTACWNCLSDYLDDPGLREYRRDNPDSMGRWTKKGQTYFITYPDTKGAPSEITTDQLSFPAPKGTTYRGAFRSSGGMTVGGVENYTTSSWSEDLRMDKSGRFSWAKDSGFFGGSGGVGFAGSNSSPEASGTYSINGYVIQFMFDNGRVETKSFVHFPSENDFFIIDGSSYWIPSD